MSSTTLTTSRPFSSTLGDRNSSRYSNSASSPLPFIPRRVPTTVAHRGSSFLAPTTAPSSSTPKPRRSVAEPSAETEPKRSKAFSSLIHGVGDVDSDSESSGLSDDPSQPSSEARNVKANNAPVISPAERPSARATTPVRGKGSWDDATFYPLDANSNGGSRPSLSCRRMPSGVTRLRVKIEPRPNPAEPPSASSASSLAPLVELPPTIRACLGRKRSGEPLKSSLKSSKSFTRGSLDVVTGNKTSKSEPATPTHSKAVHFDAQLEYVKLFLAEQRPLAVSRDGSPTDTSGTDSDFPSFVYGTASEEGKKINKLVMEITNMPPRRARNAEIALEELKLSPDYLCILGRVMVQNIAYEKRVAVRFTFDSWHTISEVIAKYSESVEGGKLDRFVFSMKLEDVLPRIEEKTLVLALRYVVAGREIWDSNGGSNYVVKFSAPPSRREIQVTDKKLSQPGDLSDLRKRLEKMAKDGNGRGLYTRPVSDEKPPPSPDESSLSSRYDLKASLRSPLKPPSPRHVRANTHPWLSQNYSPSKSPHVKTLPSSRGSPRESSGSSFQIVPFNDCDFEGLPFTPPFSPGGIEGHPSSYFDPACKEPPSFKRTPTASPRTSPTRSVPFIMLPPSQDIQTPLPSQITHSYLGWIDSDENKALPSSATSSSSASSSLSISPTETSEAAGRDIDSYLSPHSPLHNQDYNQLLNQCVGLILILCLAGVIIIRRYCFYTGSDSLHVPFEPIPRSHSDSSINFLSPSPSSDFDILNVHSRSPSFDDIMYRSGSATPTSTNVSPRLRSLSFMA